MADKKRRMKVAVAVGSIDAELGEILGRELLAVCIAALKQYGVNSARLRELCREAVALPGKIPTASKLIRDADRLADLATEWMENILYVDSIGKPKVLPIEGPEPSFAGLVRKYFKRSRIGDVLNLGLRTRVLERVGPTKVAQFGGCVIFAGNRNLMLVHAIQSVRSFLGTTLKNAVSKEASLATVPDRKASAMIPERCVDEFIEIMRQAIINTIEMGNRWLTAQGKKRKSMKKGGKKVKVGVHAYVFRDPAP